MKSRRPCLGSGFTRDLYRLRRGDLSFDRFAGLHRKRIQGYALHFFHRWNPDGLTLDDMTQEALIAIWRAVDEWDPDRGTLILDFVEFQTRRHLRVECERSLGWPDKRRKKGARRTIYSEDSPVPADQQVHATDLLSRPDAIAMVREAAALFDGIERDATIGVGVGAPIKSIAQYLYSDPKRRRAYDLGSLDETIRAVRKTVRRVPERISKPNA